VIASPAAEYTARLEARRARLAELDRSHLLISNGRLITAGAGAILLWAAFVSRVVSPMWPLLAWLAFGVLVVVHARLLLRVDRARNAARWYVRGLERLSGRWAGTGRDGAVFLEGHAYARDLDVFGPSSLFELINTTRTAAGESTLAAWFSAGAPVDEVRARQAAVAELRPLLDLREDIAVLGDESAVGRTGPLASWAHAAPSAFSARLRQALPVLSAVTLLVAFLVYREQISSGVVLLWLLVVAEFQWLLRRRVEHAIHAVETPERDLALLTALLERVEREPFQSPRLMALRQSFVTDGVVASRRIAQLRRLVSWADSTHNLMFAPVAFVLFVKPHLAVAIDRWHARYGPAVGEWLRAVGEIEALAALATYGYERPSDPFPDLAAPETPVFSGEAVGHPLLPDDRSVRNDVRLGGDGPRVLIVSGSNMSGKSTLLRAVGLNVVLALAGAPVRAAALRLSPLVLGATLRIDDSLPAGHSRFYAEILRLRDIVASAKGTVPLLFLLDEILHGTNSHDRRIGAEGVVTALVRLGAIGLVTTHDLALTELPRTLGAVAANWHFEDTLQGGRMVFDYTMRPGIVEHSNALALMRAIGLDV
jgi:hypothetical protein